MRVRLGVVLVLVLALTGCARSPAGDRDEASTGVTAAADSATAQPSLFELSFPLTDQAGRTRHLEEFRGAPFVASMIYTNCTSVCPRVTADLKSLEAALPVNIRAHTRFVLFSLDPKRDTPEALSGFAREHGLDLAHWTLLAAGPDDMRTLAAVLGMKYRPDGAGEIAHSALILVVDGGGVVRHRQVGVTDDVAPLVAAVRGVD